MKTSRRRFSKKEYANRQLKVRQAMEKKGLGGCRI